MKPIWCRCGHSVILHTERGACSGCPPGRHQIRPGLALAGFSPDPLHRSVLYFATNTSNEQLRAAMDRGYIGQILTPNAKTPTTPRRLWCADTGCFSERNFTEERWWSWLSKTTNRTDCLFATVPDVWMDAVATAKRSAPWLERVRSLGLPAAIVAQDGQEDVPIPWDDIDALFVGGSTPFKLSGLVRELIGEALSLGKHVHIGKVNSKRRIRWCEAVGAHSADGTYVAFGPDRNTAIMLGWLDDINGQQGMFGLEPQR